MQTISSEGPGSLEGVECGGLSSRSSLLSCQGSSVGEGSTGAAASEPIRGTPGSLQTPQLPRPPAPQHLAGWGVGGNHLHSDRVSSARATWAPGRL